MLLKLSNLNSNLTLTLGYLIPALDNSAVIDRLLYVHKADNKRKRDDLISGIVIKRSMVYRTGEHFVCACVNMGC